MLLMTGVMNMIWTKETVKAWFVIRTNFWFTAIDRFMFEWKRCEHFSFACLWLAALAAPRCTAPPKKSCGNALDLPPLYCTQEMRQCAHKAVVQQSSKELLPGSCCFSGDYGRKAWKPKCGVTQSFTHHGQAPLVFIVPDLNIFFWLPNLSVAM